MCKEAVGQWLEKPVGGEQGSLTAEYTGLTGLSAQTHSGWVFFFHVFESVKNKQLTQSPQFFQILLFALSLRYSIPINNYEKSIKWLSYRQMLKHLFTNRSILQRGKGTDMKNNSIWNRGFKS